MGHGSFGRPVGFKRTKARINYTFYWPGLLKDCEQNVKTSETCQLIIIVIRKFITRTCSQALSMNRRRGAMVSARVTCRDRVPIKPIPKTGCVFDHWFIDYAGPFFNAEGQKVKYYHTFIAVYSFSRFPVCYAMRSLTAKNVCDALLELWHFTGCCSYISSDLGINFTAQLTKEFEKRMGCVPRFNSPYHPQSTGLAELVLSNMKNILSKLAMDHPKRWHTYLSMVMWCLREVPNETTAVAPWTTVMRHLSRGPLAILEDRWYNQELLITFGKMPRSI